MAEQKAKSRVKQIEMQAVVIRADGTREYLGTIAYWHRNPIKRLWRAIQQHIKGDRYDFLRRA